MKIYKFKHLNIYIEYIAILLFIIAICIPIIQMTFHIFNETSLNENRNIAQLPKINYDSLSNGNFTIDFENYFNDNFGMRYTLIKISNYSDYHIFRRANNPLVILGKNDFFYYSPTLDDYDNISLPEEKIALIANKIESLQNELKKNDVNFLFFVAPNKNTIYPEYMPRERKFKFGQSNYKILLNELTKRNVNCIDLVPLLNERKGENDLYYKRDTHWNHFADLFVSQAILQKLNNPQIPEILSYVDDNRLGDLNLMLGFTETEKALIPVTKEISVSQKLPKTIWFHDSFSLGLFPIIKPYFSELVEFHHAEEASLAGALVDNISDTKFVVFEIAERDIPNLLLSRYDFDIFNNISYKELDKYRQFDLELGLSSSNDSTMIVNESGLSFFTTGTDPWIYYRLHKPEKVNYISIEFNEMPPESDAQVFWEKPDAKFNEQDSIRFQVHPKKNIYIIKLNNYISGIRLDLGSQPNLIFNIKSIRYYTD